MVQAVICREMKWTYEEYLDAPSWFIDMIVDMLQAEARANKKDK